MPTRRRYVRPLQTRLPGLLAFGLVLLLGTASPAGAADAPDSCAAATTASPLKTWLADDLAAPTDVDWFLFQKPAASVAIATLGQLPGNYRLDLYGACDTLLATSDQSGNAFEEIQRSLPAGSYRLRVSHVSGPIGGYRVKLFERAPNTCDYISYQTWIGPGDTWNIVGELLNTHAVDIYQPRVALTFYKDGAVVHFPIAVGILPREIVAGGRAPFSLALDPPPAAHDRVWVDSRCEPQGGDTPLPRLRIVSWASSIDPQGRRHFSGTLRNDTGVAVAAPQAFVTLHDTLGRVTSAASVVVPAGPNSTLDPGQTAAFDLVVDRHHAANRVRLFADAFVAVID
jgi:hypothetical protein